MSNHKPNKAKGTSSPTKKTTCGMCGKKNYGDCVKGMDNCFGCGKSGHKVRDFPIVRGKYKVVVKLKQVVQMRLQRRTVSMLSALGVINTLLLMW